MKKIFLPLFLSVFAFTLYFNSLFNGFVYDDIEVIVNNKNLQNFKSNIQNFFNKKYFIISGEQTYRPIATLTYFVNYQIWKLNPFGYHLTSVLLYIITVLLLYILLNKLFNNIWFSFLVTLFYLSHPVLTEAINCIAFNEDILVTLFYILTLIFYINYTKDKKYYNYFFSLLFFMLALFSKEMAITLFLVIIFYDLFLSDFNNFYNYKKRFKNKNSFKINELIKQFFNIIKTRRFVYLGYVSGSILYLYFSFFSLERVNKIAVFSDINFLKRIIYLPNNLFEFIKLVFIPINLNVYYDFLYPESFFSVTNIISYLIVIVVNTIHYLHI